MYNTLMFVSVPSLPTDLTAPGVDILAAWSPKAPMSEYGLDPRSVKYNMSSGSSVACAHATGVAAYVKSFHPKWSPDAIRSALMTTASPLNSTKNPYGEFAYRAGQINPLRAVDPGLVYDADEADYIKMLCAQGYNSDKIKLISGDNSHRPDVSNITVRDFNYPLMTAFIKDGSPVTIKFSRTVTNVGPANSTYKATVTSKLKAIKVTVVPTVLSFKSSSEKQDFVVTVVGELPTDATVSGSLVWSDGKHKVRSPIFLFTRFTYR
ncbi:subtilisin-like protease SBT4.3 [Magnolia sinica]|uniref:subtilisin-like protease SBT4.3 n=1 Tax=Magnolia sinica TaxID=86752 RepID=UPI00265AA260|nr:subtilisin-like protease SBT4.3 [Magnolia sinica]